MNSTSRTITLASLTVLGCTALAVIAAVWVPFNVKQPATIQSITGAAEIASPGQTAAVLDLEETPALTVGQTLILHPGSSARVTFELNGGHAIIMGPARLTLVNSYRRATLSGHVFNSSEFDRRYTLTLEQMLGTVRYNFAGANPPVEDVAITIRLPDGNYRPSTPCWEVTVSASGETETKSFECPY